jgi:hypothetical protein
MSFSALIRRFAIKVKETGLQGLILKGILI